MNDFSTLPAPVPASRLSSPEAGVPDAASPILQARRLKLRRIVAWVVGGAALLMCAGLVRAALHTHSEAAALNAAASPAVMVTPPASPAAARALPTPERAATAATAAAAPASGAVSTLTPKKTGVGSHSSKLSAKTARRTTGAKSAVARHL